MQLDPHTFAQSYESRDPDYTPTDHERALIEDAICAYLSALPSSAPRIQAETKGEVVAWHWLYNHVRYTSVEKPVFSPRGAERIEGPWPLYASPPVAAVPDKKWIIEAGNALAAVRPILETLIATEYNVDTWGLRSRLAAVDQAIRSLSDSRAGE